MYLAKYFMKQDPKRTIGRRLILANLLVRFGHLYLLVWGFPAKAVTFWDTFAKIMLAAMSYSVMSSALCSSPTSFEHDA